MACPLSRAVILLLLACAIATDGIAQQQQAPRPPGHVLDTKMLVPASEATPGDVCLPPSEAAVDAAMTRPSSAQLMMACLAVLLATLALLCYAANRNVVLMRDGESVEQAVARSKGIVLQALIGEGVCGRVFRGLYRGTTVAVKIVILPRDAHQAAAEVARACGGVQGCRHPCLVQCLTHFNVTVRSSWRRQLLRTKLAGTRGERHLQQRTPQQRSPPPSPQPLTDGQLPLGGAAACRTAGAQAAAGIYQQHQPEAAAGSPPANGGAGGGGAGFMAATPPLEGEHVALAVLEHGSLGNLHTAIASGRFYLDRQLQQLNLDWVCRTARDVALALAHMHDRQRMVHRDVSATNVLLVPDSTDPRGFRAKLSNLELYHAMRSCRPCDTSQLKSSFDCVPPEVLSGGELGSSADIYSLGILICWLCLGNSPFAKLPPVQVVRCKLEGMHRGRQLELPLSMPAALRNLVWDCCQNDSQQRPSAVQVVGKLQEALQLVVRNHVRQAVQISN